MKQKRLFFRILFSLFVFLFLLLVRRGHAENMSFNPVFLYLFPYWIVGFDVIRKAVKNILRGQIFDENFLMCVATVAAFGIGEYAEAFAVMLFYQIGELFQGYAVEKSRASISEMMQIAPEYANLETAEGVKEVDPEDVCPGDILIIRAGEKIPIDGVIVEGGSFLDSRALTGESVPRRVSVGEEVISGCVNGDSVLRIRASRRYEDSAVARILELVENAGDKKAKLERFITRFARRYTPVVTVLAALLALIPPLFFSEVPSVWIRRACIFLIVSCPCALVISIPLGFFGGIGAASKIGILVKGANFIEALSAMHTLVFDKTGTLTKGEFSVQEIIPAAESGLGREELLSLAAAAEEYSTHPVAKSIRAAFGKKANRRQAEHVREIPGKGIEAEVDGETIWVGNASLMREKGVEIEEIFAQGTVLYIAGNGTYLGALTISDCVKDGISEAVRELREVGIRRLVMLSGDRKEAAEAVGREVGIDEVYSELLPEEKVNQVERLLEKKKTLGFVGDGINDAPVLMRADIGIAMGNLGADAAIEAADVVLMDDDIRKIAALIRISRKTMRIVKENILFSLSVKAAVLLFGALGFASMWEAVFADVGVTVLAVLNSMRLLKK